MIVLWIVLSIIGGILGLFVLYLLFTIVCSAFVGKKEYDKNSRFYRFLLNSWTLIAFGILRIKLDVKGMEKIPESGRFLLVSNHRSKFDPIVSWWAFRKYDLAFLSKKENFGVPFFGNIIRKCCFMAIDRENARNALMTIKRSAELMKANEVSIGVYPEGTRSQSDEMLPFHDGVFKIAKMADAPVAVVALKGTDDVHKNFPKRGTRIYIDVVEVIPRETVAASTSHDLSKIAREALEKGYNNI